MKNILSKNKYFLFLYLLLLLGIGPIIILFPKANIHLAINNYNSPVFDFVFKYFTHLGDGLTFLIIGLVLLVFSIRKSILVICSGVLAGLLTQVLKRFIFDDIARPSKFLAEYPLHLVDGVKMYTSNSFPSGHTATIFALCFALASLTSSLFNKIVLFCIAVAIGFSRIYLSQHFLIDTYVGSAIGVVAALVVIYYLNKQQAAWLDKSLPKVLIRTAKNE